jgi:hypothetical protein
MMMNVLAETTPLVKVKCININNSNKSRKYVENYGENDYFHDESSSKMIIPSVHLVNSSKQGECVNGMKRKKSLENNDDGDERDSNFLQHDRMEKKCKFDNMNVDIAKKLSKKSANEDELNEKDIWMLVNKYDDLFEWEQIGKSLGLSKTDLQIIKYEHLDKIDLGGLKECLYQVFLKWRMYEPENFNIGYLLKFFKSKMNKTNDFIEDIKNSMSTKSHEKSAQLMNHYFKVLIDVKKNECKYEKDLHVYLNESELWKASEILNMDWKSIGRYLGISESDLNNIQIMYLRTDGLRECCYQTLLLWSQQFNDQTYLDNLCTFLIELRFNFYAKKLIENICFN